MIGLRVEVGAAGLLANGAVAVVLAPGAALPPLPPLLALEWHSGVLLPPGSEPDRLAPLPAGARLLALVAPDRIAAARIAPLLPAGVTQVIGGDPLAGLLRIMAGAVQTAWEARSEAEAARDAAVRVLGRRPALFPRLMLDTAPDLDATVAPPVTQPLGRPAEGVCAVALHLAAAADEANPLRVRLRVGDRIRGAWIVPGSALGPGWLRLDLPEPLRAGAAEAVVEVVTESDGVLLSATRRDGGAPLAIRAWTAPPGRYVMPLHCDWSALDVALTGLPFALPAEALDAAEVSGGTGRLIALGEEEPRLLIELDGPEATVAFPPLPAGPVDLLRMELACRGGASIECALRLEAPSGVVESGWRGLDEDGALTLTLPLPAAPVRPRLSLRGGATVVEVSRLAVMAGAAGEARLAPPVEAPRVSAAPGRPAGPAFSVALPGSGFRTAPPQPPLMAASPGAPVMMPAAGGAEGSSGPLGTVSFADVAVQQHMVSPDGGYRHLDVVVSGLVGPIGLWRQVRTKLFDRRGVVGLEFREAKGWPQMFDVWPAGRTDAFGPFWRLETEGTATQLAALATPHDRALIAALLEMLPDLAARAAASAGLDSAEAEAWKIRGKRLAEAVAGTRGVGQVAPGA